MPNEIRDVDLDHAVEMYRAGASVRELVERLNIDRWHIETRIRAAGCLRTRNEALALKQRQKRDGIRPAVLALYAADRSVKAIATELGVLRCTVVACLKDAGITPRSRRESMLLRMSQTPEAERQELARAAHNAVRGMKRTDEELAQRARTKQVTLSKVGIFEDWMMNRLTAAGIDHVNQFALGPYNIDIMCWPVAVEIDIRKRNPIMNPITRKRLKYLLDRNISVIHAWSGANSSVLDEEAAEHVIAFVKLAKTFPPGAAEYRVIGRAGELIARGGLDRD